MTRRTHCIKTAEFYNIHATSSYIYNVDSLLSRIKATEEAQLKTLEDDMFNELMVERGMHGCSISEGFDTYSTARKQFIGLHAVRKRLFNVMHRFVKSTPGIINENYKARRQQGEQLWIRILTRAPPDTFIAVCRLFFIDSSFALMIASLKSYWLLDKS